MIRRTSRTPVLLSVAAMTLAACGGAPESEPDDAVASGDFPVTVESCGSTSTLDVAPERAITMNQGATEVALALGLEDRLIGTAYLDDEVPDRWKDAYDSVEVLSAEYPDHETVLAAEPDFVYASYASAFDKEAAGTPDELGALDIGSYTSPLGCGDDQLPDVSFDTVWDEIETVAEAFGVPERASTIRVEQEEQLSALAAETAGAGTEVFWFDSGDKTALAGAGEGGPQLVLEAVGATNVFDDLDGGWADVSWERVVDADPDVIVLADASWSSADDKIAMLKKDPALRDLQAVREDRFVVLPYSESTPGVRLVDGAQRVADGLDELDLG